MRFLTLIAVGGALGGCSFVTDFDRSYKAVETDGIFPGVKYLPPPETGEEADTSLCKNFCRAWTDCLAQPNVCHALWASEDEENLDVLATGCETDCKKQATITKSQLDHIRMPSGCATVAGDVVADFDDFRNQCRQWVDFCADGCGTADAPGPLLECFSRRAQCNTRCVSQRVSAHLCVDEKLGADENLTQCGAIDQCWGAADPQLGAEMPGESPD